MLLIGCVSSADAQVSVEAILLREGWLSNEFRVLACSQGTGPWQVELVTDGSFSSPGNTSAKVRRSNGLGCLSESFRSSATQNVVEVRAEGAAKIIAVTVQKHAWLSSQTAWNFAFLVAGAALLGMQDMFKMLFSAPAFFVKSWSLFRTNVRMIELSRNDAHKAFTLSKELRDIVEAPTADVRYLPERLVDAIEELVKTYDIWKEERPLTAETRERLKQLGGIRLWHWLRR